MGNVSKWGERLARVASMDRRELVDRLGQYLNARTDVLRYGGYDNLSLDSQVNTTEQGIFFFTPEDVPSICSALKQVFPLEAADIVSRAEKICSHRFDLLGFEGLDYGADIDWHWDAVHKKRAPRQPWFKVKYLNFDQVGDSKITWELNRHQHFVTLAKAYWLSGDEKYAREIFAQWTRWHEENPYPIGINWASSLEVAFRSISWIWTFFLLRECPLFSIALRKQWKAALSLNGRHIETYLSTYFSPNTHLVGEALALFCLGVTFPSLKKAAKWRDRGWRILQAEAAKQVRADGFYFEQSTHYHVYALDMFLHARILAALDGIAIPAAFDQILQRMLTALLLLCRAGVPPMIGDDDGGRLFDPRRNRSEHMLDPLATGAILYAREDLKAYAGRPREETLWLLGKSGLDRFDSLQNSSISCSSAVLPDGGLYLMGDENEGQLLIDAGPLGALKGGHAHASALNICLVRKGRQLLIDPGTGEYAGLAGDRARLRGTGAHNTMQVDGSDQAESAGPFAWKKPPHVKVEQWISGPHFDLFQGRHDGYSRLFPPVLHRRWVFHERGGLYVVCDRAEGSGLHQLDVAWHLGSRLAPDRSHESVFTADGVNLMLVAAGSPGWSRSVRQDFCSPAYGYRERETVVNISGRMELPADCATLLIASESSPPEPGHLLSNSSNASVCSYRYLSKQKEQTFHFARQTGAWTLGPWASDANFLTMSFDRVREEYTLILCNGSYIELAGHRVLSCDRNVSYAEISSSVAKSDLFTSDPGAVALLQSLDAMWSDAESLVEGNDPREMGV